MRTRSNRAILTIVALRAVAHAVDAVAVRVAVIGAPPTAAVDTRPAVLAGTSHIGAGSMARATVWAGRHRAVIACPPAVARAHPIDAVALPAAVAFAGKLTTLGPRETRGADAHAECTPTTVTTVTAARILPGERRGEGDEEEPDTFHDLIPLATQIRITYDK